jgi:hypothetical protein
MAHDKIGPRILLTWETVYTESEIQFGNKNPLLLKVDYLQYQNPFQVLHYQNILLPTALKMPCYNQQYT